MSNLQLNREELAWCAGFLDGEGNFGYKKGTRSMVYRISAAQTDRAVLDRVQQSLGGKVYGPYGPYATNKQPYWQWSTTNFQATQNAMCLVWQWLSPVKRNQAAQAQGDFLEYCKTRNFTGKRAA